MQKRGTFITFEGIDGCGKTTQMHLLGERLRASGHPVVETIEPGGTEIGRQIRKILLDARNAELNDRAELLLYFASRAQNVEQVIQPALARGAIVLCDRFTDSTLAYQGSGRGLDPEPILELDRIACAGLQPDVTVLIDIDLETSMERSRNRNQRLASAETRIDDESAAFHARVLAGYHALAQKYPDRIIAVDGRASICSTAQAVWQRIASRV
ncbi:MAG: thymidylate kinase [Bryobacterales bacterium]|nr:thymidylate kinase [Bryobacterales bacterium]